jgi:hypothetical protein
MKYLICLFIILSCSEDSLLQKITNDFSKQSPFLFVRLKSSNTKSFFYYCIKNDDLFRFLLDDSKIGTDKYPSIVLKAITEKKAIICKNERFEKLEKNKFKINIKLQSSLKKLNFQQVKHLYFKGNILKNEISEYLKLQIIYSLFEKNIFVTVDDESGEYILY